MKKDEQECHLHCLIKDPIRKIRNKNKVMYIIKASYLDRLWAKWFTCLFSFYNTKNDTIVCKLLF